MTATNTAVNASITATNVAIAAQAQRAADEARHDRCKIEMEGYSAKGATVAEMQSYAGCVDFVYPTHTEADVIVWKIIAGVLIAGFVIGAVVGFFTSDYDTVMDTVSGAAGGLMLAFTGLALVGGVMFIFS